MQDPRVIAFRKLKPLCVELSQVVLAFKGRKASGRDVADALDPLYEALAQMKILDVKLADYVFFPVSHVFHESAKLPNQVIKLSLKCLSLLIVRGWNQFAPPALFKELFVLLSFVVSQEDGKTNTGSLFTDDVKSEAVICFKDLFLCASRPVLLFCRSSRDEATPVIGNAIGTLLESVKFSSSITTQVAGAEAIAAMILCFSGDPILVNFLPGIASGLTQMIEPSTRSRRSYRVIVAMLNSLSSILKATLGDDVRALEPFSTGSALEVNRSDEWIAANAAQTKLALSNVVRIRDHQRPEVQQALFSLCLGVISESKLTLYDSIDLMLETSLLLCNRTLDSRDQTRESDLQRVLEGNDDIVFRLNKLAYDWLSSLTRIMQGADDTKHRNHLAKLSTAFRISNGMGLNTDLLEDKLLSSLLESARTLIYPSSSKPDEIASYDDVATPSALALMSDIRGSTRFDVLPSSNGATIDSLALLQDFLRTLHSQGAMPHAVERLSDVLSVTSRQDMLPALWLISQFATKYQQENIDTFLNLPNEGDERDSELSLDVAYSSALDILNSDTRPKSDWRLEAVALQVLATNARRQGVCFQNELVDSLFPVLERLGAPSVELRKYAMACLNIFTEVCGAGSPGMLVVQNVDYLVNSIALKFNAFDVSPQTPRVLVMMLELSGSDLIPYLDDIVDSVFSALASFHGNPRLVGSLFSVLDAVVKQASSSESKLLEAPRINHCKIGRPQMSIIDVLLCFPAREHSLGDPTIDNESETSKTEQDADERSLENESQLSLSKPYQMVESIVRLTQHYLTQDAESIRQRLLQVVQTGSIVLSRNEEKFLPLVNDLWPVIVKRLFDPEPNVSIEAMKTLRALFQSAGDFLSTRIQDEWEDIRRLARTAKSRLDMESRKSHGIGKYTLASRVWEGLVEMLVDLIHHVRITPEAEDDIFDLLLPQSFSQPNVLNALEKLNSDALWLAKLQHQIPDPNIDNPIPQFSGYKFRDCSQAMLSREQPTSSHHS